MIADTDSDDDHLLGLCKTHKYQKLREIYDVKGFVVNVHDSANFDIDLNIPRHLSERYSSVITNTYSYKDMSEDFIKSPDLEKVKALPSLTGQTYRCRLKGIGLRTDFNNWETFQRTIMVRRLIDRADGWVTCTISDIDIYRRLLIDIQISVKDRKVDLKEFLLGSDKGSFYFDYRRH